MRTRAIALGLAALCVAGCGPSTEEILAQSDAEAEAWSAREEQKKGSMGKTLPPEVFVALGGDPRPAGRDTTRWAPPYGCIADVFSEFGGVEGDEWFHYEMEKDEDHPSLAIYFYPYANLHDFRDRQGVVIEFDDKPNFFSKYSILRLSQVPSKLTNGCFRYSTTSNDIGGIWSRFEDETLTFDYCPYDPGRSSGEFKAHESTLYEEEFYMTDYLVKISQCIKLNHTPDPSTW